MELAIGLDLEQLLALLVPDVEWVSDLPDPVNGAPRLIRLGLLPEERLRFVGLLVHQLLEEALDSRVVEVDLPRFGLIFTKLSEFMSLPVALV